jgi:hypothetical protein
MASRTCNMHQIAQETDTQNKSGGRMCKRPLNPSTKKAIVCVASNSSQSQNHPQSVLAFVQFVKISERRPRNALFCQIQFGRIFQRAKINHLLQLNQSPQPFTSLSVM